MAYFRNVLTTIHFETPFLRYLSMSLLKKYVSKNKIYFGWKKKSNVLLNKKVIFVFYTIFKLDFVAQIIYFILYANVCVLFSYFFCSLTSVSNKRNIETMLTLSYWYNRQKFNNKMNKKRSKEYQSIDPEYVTGQINSRILELVLRQFCCLIFAPSEKS